MNKIETAVDICNMALNRLGTETIESLNQEFSDNAKLCLFWYDTTRRNMLKDINASFAIKRVSIADNGEVDPISNGKYFPIPNDCLNILKVYSSNKEEIKRENFNIERNCIIVEGDAPLYIRYLADETNVTMFDDEFSDLLATALACNLSPKITQDIELTNYLEKLKEKQYINCTFKYGNDNKIKVVYDSKYRDIRVG